MERPNITYSGAVLDCDNIAKLSQFYLSLLGWEIVEYEDEVFIIIRSPDKAQRLSFQHVEGYVPPVWPWSGSDRQQMAHLDFAVDDVAAAVEYAVQCGAKIASAQYFERHLITTMIDPAGHPFCIGRN